MHINRNNYEEYFLLYADNELSAAEKELVEEFVRQNIDLKDEFSIIQFTVSSPDKSIKISDKSFLLKQQSAITENNYEEFFILYYDDELTEDQKKETERFAEQNIKFKTEFEFIGKSKLAADNAVIYPYKKQLYKKEKRGRVIEPIWIKTAAAAILIGFGLWISVSYFNESNTTPHLSTLNDTFNQPITTGPKQDETSIAEKHDQKIDSGSHVAQTGGKLNRNEPEIQTVDLNKPVTKRDVVTIKKEKIVNEIVKPDLIDVNVQLTTPDKITEELPVALTTVEKALQDGSVVNEQHNIDSEVPDIAPVQAASYNSSNSNDQDYVFYDISVEDFRKSKVGEIFKKVKRVVERNNPITHLFGNEEQTASKN